MPPPPQPSSLPSLIYSRFKSAQADDSPLTQEQVQAGGHIKSRMILLGFVTVNRGRRRLPVRQTATSMNVAKIRY